MDSLLVKLIFQSSFSVEHQIATSWWKIDEIHLKVLFVKANVVSIKPLIREYGTLIFNTFVFDRQNNRVLRLRDY